jgi:hypothetical protein
MRRCGNAAIVTIGHGDAAKQTRFLKDCQFMFKPI